MSKLDSRMVNRDASYSINVRVRSDRKVHLGLVGEREYATGLTPADAKRVAYALLLAADGDEPAFGDSEQE